MIRSHIKKLQDFTVFTGAGHKLKDHMCNILLPLRLLDQKPVSVTMIPGTGSRLALLLLTMSAALFGWKLPDGALRFFPCVSKLFKSDLTARSRNKKAARPWHQLLPSQSQQPQNSPFMLGWLSCKVDANAQKRLSPQRVLHTRAAQHPSRNRSHIDLATRDAWRQWKKCVHGRMSGYMCGI